MGSVGSIGLDPKRCGEERGQSDCKNKCCLRLEVGVRVLVLQACVTNSLQVCVHKYHALSPVSAVHSGGNVL